jgi:hypothetical protein
MGREPTQVRRLRLHPYINAVRPDRSIVVTRSGPSTVTVAGRREYIGRHTALASRGT